MNQVLNTIKNHRSIRKYKDADVSREDLATIIDASQMAASSINGQQVSIIAVRDPKTKKEISKLSGDQKWIDEAPIILIYALDFYRAKLGAEKNDEDLVITENLESIMVGCVDVGLAMGNGITAAESLGLGTVPIGGIRKSPTEMIELLKLPKYVYPVCGLVIGHPDENPSVKPRFPKDAVFFDEEYNTDLHPLIDAYDNTMSEYMLKRTHGESDRNWSQTISNVYKYVYFPKVSPSIKSQGFENK